MNLRVKVPPAQIPVWRRSHIRQPTGATLTAESPEVNVLRGGREPEPVDGRTPASLRVPSGTGISYGHTHRTGVATVIATLPAGYADGYPRLLSNRAEVLVRGRRYPVVGRICMDQCLIDLATSSTAPRWTWNRTERTHGGKRIQSRY